MYDDYESDYFEIILLVKIFFSETQTYYGSAGTYIYDFAVVIRWRIGALQTKLPTSDSFPHLEMLVLRSALFALDTSSAYQMKPDSFNVMSPCQPVSVVIQDI